MTLVAAMTAHAKLTEELTKAVANAAKAGMDKSQIQAAIERLAELVDSSDEE